MTQSSESNEDALKKAQRELKEELIRMRKKAFQEAKRKRKEEEKKKK
jgi:hypothetical protein